MLLSDAIKLIYHKTLVKKHSIWIDLGCGSGLFTHALANVVQEGSIIYALDKNTHTLASLPNPNQVIINPIQTDFEKEIIENRNLDGILMANSLHFVKDKLPLLLRLSESIKIDGSFLIVEYDSDIANPWVPYPVNFNSLLKIFSAAGFQHGTKLREIPSKFTRANIYCALFTRN